MHTLYTHLLLSSHIHTKTTRHSLACIKAGLLAAGAMHVPGIDLGAGMAEGWGPGAGNLAVGTADMESWPGPP